MSKEDKNQDMNKCLKWGYIMLGTCGIKGITAALMFDLCEKMQHTAQYFQISGIVTMVIGVFLVAYYAHDKTQASKRDSYMERVRGEKWDDFIGRESYK